MLTYIHWFTTNGLNSEISMGPPAEFETTYHRQQPVEMAGSDVHDGRFGNEWGVVQPRVH